MQKLTANAQIQIQKSMNDVFQAIIEPSKISNYFISESGGALETDKTIQWSFPEFPKSFTVTGKEIIPNTYVSFDWSGGEANHLVEIFLSEGDNNSNVVRTVEHEMENTPDGVERMKRQTGGWANFMADLKAYFAFGINLRTGAFDYMKQWKTITSK